MRTKFSTPLTEEQKARYDKWVENRRKYAEWEARGGYDQPLPTCSICRERKLGSRGTWECVVINGKDICFPCWMKMQEKDIKASRVKKGSSGKKIIPAKGRRSK